VESGVYRVFRIFNLCEGILWISLAVGFVLVLWRKRQNAGLMATSGLLLMMFGISDFVEIGTGGWYKPWWLLVWKASTLLGLVVVFVLFRRRRRQPL